MANARHTIGISVSSPPEPELIALGLSGLHVRHVFIELVRHVLASGWDVAYGGDLRSAGYTEALFDLVRTYNRRDVAGPERVRCYLHWPVWAALTPKDRADLANVATLVEVSAPPDVDVLDGGLREDPPIIARCVEAMRARMTAEIDARVVLGGRTWGQRGIVPGVVDEADRAIARGLPVFVAGGFGGAARLVAEALRGESPQELTADFQAGHTPDYDELDFAGNASAVLASLVERLQRAGLPGLQNGLEDDENARLMDTDDADEVVALVLRGVRRLTGGAASPPE
jgi:hypothetical protein